MAKVRIAAGQEDTGNAHNPGNSGEVLSEKEIKMWVKYFGKISTIALPTSQSNEIIDDQNNVFDDIDINIK